MKILKFGGTSVGAAESLKTVLEIVKREMDAGEPPVVVLSAMSGVTNALNLMAENAAAGLSFAQDLDTLEKKHFDAAKSLLDIQAQNAVFTRLKIYFNELEDILQAIYSLKELTPQTRDLVLSYGERCLSFLVSRVALRYFPQAIYTEATELIKTDSSFGYAKVSTDLSNLLIQDYYEQNSGKLSFVTGFIASDTKGKITTLGRGGSDYTAAILGAALHASEIQIWTDVNGMMTADPRMVKKAFPLAELSYTEAMELSFFGAKVIYPPTMTPAFLKKIPIVIKNTFDLGFEGSYIRHDCAPSNMPVKGISCIEHVSIINVEGSGMVGKSGFSGRLFSLLAREQINIVLITQSSSEHSISFAVVPEIATRTEQLILQEFELEIAAHKLELPQVERDLSVLAIVGENMKRTPGISGKLFHALGRNGVNVHAIAQGSSEYNISVIIPHIDLKKALNAVHDAFFEKLHKTLHVFFLGTGNIGKTLFQQLQQNADFLKHKNGIAVKVVGISNTRKMLVDEEGINLSEWKERLDASETDANLANFVSHMKSLNLPNCVFVDNTASLAPIGYYETVFRSSISVVTCNKIGNSGTLQQYRLFKDTAHKFGVDFFYETNVGAGLPIIRTLHDLVVSGDRVERIEAILSGTISFIFNSFKDDVAFHEVVKEAQDKGYTEPDPRDDLSGKDFMRKMLILARDAGYPLEEEDVVIENMLPPSCVAASDVPAFYEALAQEAPYFNKLKEDAAAAGKLLRYIGMLDNGKVTISLQMVDDSHPFFALSGSDNIISFTTQRYADRPLVVKGPGAGAEVTAAGVFADLINVGAR